MYPTAPRKYIIVWKDPSLILNGPRSQCGDTFTGRAFHQSALSNVQIGILLIFTANPSTYFMEE